MTLDDIHSILVQAAAKVHDSAQYILITEDIERAGKHVRVLKAAADRLGKKGMDARVSAQDTRTGFRAQLDVSRMREAAGVQWDQNKQGWVAR